VLQFRCVHVLSILPIGVCVNGVVSSQPVLNRVIVLVFKIVLVFRTVLAFRIVIEKKSPGSDGGFKNPGSNRVFVGINYDAYKSS
jgi:hypothetical protein